MSESFPWYLLIIYEGLDVAISHPTRMSFARKWVLAPCTTALALYIYTQPLSPSASLHLTAVVGGFLASRLCYTINIVYAHPDFPDFWRQTKDGEHSPSTLDVWEKVD